MRNGSPSISSARRRRRCQDVLGDRRGAAIIEFALCGSAFIALLLAAFNVALIFFAQQGLQTAAEVVARKVLTGQIRAGSMNQTTFRQNACASLPPFLRCSRLYVDLQKASDFSSADTSRPTLTYDKNGNVANNWNYSPTNAGDIVVLRLMYLWPVSRVPGLQLATESDGSRVLLGTMVFKTEPYT
jgi:Flp pilus assembly protein TadG